MILLTWKPQARVGAATCFSQPGGGKNTTAMDRISTLKGLTSLRVNDHGRVVARRKRWRAHRVLLHQEASNR